MVTPANILAALLALTPYLVTAFFPGRVCAWARRLPWWLQLLCPSLLCLPYVLVASAAGVFHVGWFALYALLPVGVACLLGPVWRGGSLTGISHPIRNWHVMSHICGSSGITKRGSGDPRYSQPGGWRYTAVERPTLQGCEKCRLSDRGNWREFLVLAVLGLAVDLRWFEVAWPAHLAIFNKMLLLDAGIYGFIALRDLEGTGFDLRLRLSDAATGLKELAWYTPIALALGLGLGFLHLHVAWPGLAPIAGAWLFTFFFIAVPEELFFRGWLQNLLEQRMGRYPALFLTAVLFGLSHFNKRAVFFNWRYVLLAAVAGVFYGRAWRRDRRVGASAMTHASVDAIWSLWLR